MKKVIYSIIIGLIIIVVEPINGDVFKPDSTKTMLVTLGN